jgi:putative NADH-flavin reductase
MHHTVKCVMHDVCRESHRAVRGDTLYKNQTVMPSRIFIPKSSGEHFSQSNFGTLQPMNLAIFGATGGTGLQVVEQAVAAGHHISVLARDPNKLGDLQTKLNVVIGNVLEPKDVAKALEQAEAVICSLGTTGGNPKDIVSAGTKNIIEGMKSKGIKRLIVVTSLGVGDSKDQVPFAFKMLMNTVLKNVMADKNVQEELVRQSGLEYTIVRPGGLSNGAKTGNYKVGTEKTIKAGQVSRADVAEFILKEISSRKFLHQAVAIT